MGFQVSGLIGHHGIAGRVRFIERIVRAWFDPAPDLLGDLFGNAVFETAVDEFLLGSHHQVLDLLADGFAQRIGFGHGKTGQFLGDLHGLLLIKNDAVGRTEDRFQFRMQIGWDRQSILAFDKLGNKLHRSGAVERHHGDDVFELRGLELFQITLHARAFQLEHAHGVAALQQGKCLFVVHRDFLGVDALMLHQINARQGVFDDGQVFQAQKIHFQKPHIFDGMQFILGHQAVVVGGGVLHWHDLI